MADQRSEQPMAEPSKPESNANTANVDANSAPEQSPSANSSAAEVSDSQTQQGAPTAPAPTAPSSGPSRRVIGAAIGTLLTVAVCLAAIGFVRFSGGLDPADKLASVVGLFVSIVACIVTLGTTWSSQRRATAVATSEPPGGAIPPAAASRRRLMIVPILIIIQSAAVVGSIAVFAYYVTALPATTVKGIHSPDALDAPVPALAQPSDGPTTAPTPSPRASSRVRTPPSSPAPPSRGSGAPSATPTKPPAQNRQKPPPSDHRYSAVPSMSGGQWQLEYTPRNFGGDSQGKRQDWVTQLSPVPDADCPVPAPCYSGRFAQPPNQPLASTFYVSISRSGSGLILNGLWRDYASRGPQQYRGLAPDDVREPLVFIGTMTQNVPAEGRDWIADIAFYRLS